MEKVFFYLLFCVLTHQSFGQMPLVHPQNNDLNLPNFSDPRLLSHARPVQSRNFVELQLDSIIHTSFDSAGQSQVTKRFLYAYSGDTTVVRSYYVVGNYTEEYLSKFVYNSQNLVSNQEVVQVNGNGQVLSSVVSTFEYYPDYPSAIKSVVENKQSVNNSDDYKLEENYFLVPGTSLLSSFNHEFFRNGVEFLQYSATYDYDSQEREIFSLFEVFDITNGDLTSYRKNTTYSPNASVAIFERKGDGSSTWSLRSKYEKEFYPGTTLLRKDNWYDWSEFNQKWVPYRKYVFTYDADDRKVEESLESYLEGVFFVKTGINTSYVQDTYVDKNVHYTFYYGDSTVYEMEQYYYAMPSSTNQPNAEKAQVELAPNPAHTYLRARTEQNIQLAELYDLQGRLVLNIATEGTNVLHLHRNNLPSGTYVLRLQLENGATVSERVQWE